LFLINNEKLVQIIPLFEKESEVPDLKPITDMISVLNTIKKTLLIWETQKDRISYSDLVTYIDEVIKLNKQATIFDEINQ
jgi:hypothetical protein